jgi:PAS domain S-box-containing protein
LNKSNKIFLSHQLIYNIEEETLYCQNELIKLTHSEQKTLQLFVQHINTPVSLNALYEHIFYEQDREFNPNTIRNIISKLRSKIKANVIENIYGSAYIIRNTASNEPSFNALSHLSNYLFDIIDQAQNGISITDPKQEDNPLVFCNLYFLKTFEYELEEILGKNPRFLRQDDAQEETILKIKQGIENNIPITVQIRNYTKSKKLIPTELTISPIFDRFSGELIYYLGIQKVLS